MVLEHILTDSVGKRVEKDFWSKCKKDRHGNPIVGAKKRETNGKCSTERNGL